MQRLTPSSSFHSTFRSIRAQAGELLACCLLYTSDAADERSSVDLGGRRIIKKNKTEGTMLSYTLNEQTPINIAKSYYINKKQRQKKVK